MIHCSPISRIFISNDRFSRLPPNIKDSIRRILLKRDLTRSQLKPLLNPNVKDYDLSDCSLPLDDLLVLSEILRNPLNGLLLIFMDAPAAEKLVVATKSLPEPDYFLIGKPCSSLPSEGLPTKRDVLKLIIWERDRYQKENPGKFVKIEKIVSCTAKHNEECSTKQKCCLVKVKDCFIQQSKTIMSNRTIVDKMVQMFKNYINQILKNRHRNGATEKNRRDVFEQSLNETFDVTKGGLRTNQGDPEPDKYEACLVPYCPLFMDHVKTSLLKKSFSSLYFTVGLVQEVGELADELKKKNDLNCKDNLVSKVGEVCWYVYGLCQSLEGIVPEVKTDEQDEDELLSVCGKLCGSIKNWSREDKDWDVFQTRVQSNVAHVLATVARHSPVSLEESFSRLMHQSMSTSRLSQMLLLKNWNSICFLLQV